MTDLDLHKLANEGGFGTAKVALQDAGYWDESAVNKATGVPAGEEREWLVTVEGTAPCTKDVRVKARNEEEAQDAAARAAYTLFDFDCVDFCEATPVTPKPNKD